MADYTDILERIAIALESWPDSQVSLLDFGQLLYIAVGGILGAILTYVVRTKVQAHADQREKEKEEKEIEDKRLLLSGLLGDEIVLRWKKKIGNDLRKHFIEYSEDNVRAIIGTMISDNDLYIFKQCSANVFSTYVFDDKTFISHLVYVYVLIKDFLDGKESLRHMFLQYQTSTLGSPVMVTEDAVREEWGNLKEAFRELDEQMDYVFKALEPEYKRYVSDNRFSRVLSEELPSEFQDKYDKYEEIRRTGDITNLERI